MNKLSLDTLKERAEAIATEGLLSSISGGLEASCHIDWNLPRPGDTGPINDSNDPWIH